MAQKANCCLRWCIYPSTQMAKRRFHSFLLTDIHLCDLCVLSAKNTEAGRSQQRNIGLPDQRFLLSDLRHGKKDGFFFFGAVKHEITVIFFYITKRSINHGFHILILACGRHQGNPCKSSNHISSFILSSLNCVI